MDKFHTHFLWLDNHGWVKDLQDMEVRNRKLNAGKCHADQTSSESASFIALDDGYCQNPTTPLPSTSPSLAHELASSVHFDYDNSWEHLSLEEIVSLLDDSHELPSVRNFIFALQKCRKQKNTEFAARIHMHALGYGLDSHTVIGNHLVPMLVECGHMSEAQCIFNRLDFCNEHAWTALVRGYINSEDSENAINLSDRMLYHGVKRSRHTYVALLKACARFQQLRRGRELHAELIEEHWESDLFIGNTLVDMYAKCGSLLEAQKVFDTMPLHDVVSWTALLVGYAVHGHGHEALDCLDRMHSENVFFNDVAFVCGLKACGNVGQLDKGRELHAEIVMNGYEEVLYVGNALVDMYAKCGRLGEARFVFNRMSARDEVSWNVLIGGNAEHGHGEEALCCLAEMRKEGMRLNVVTFICSLKACSSIAALDMGKELHAEIDREGYGSNLLVGNALMDMYCRCGSVVEAESLFNKMPMRDVVSWTTIMAGYAEHGLADKALHCLKELQREGVRPDMVAYLLSLKSCSSLGFLSIGREIHAEIDREGYGADLAIGNTLVDMYVKCGSLEDAQDVFRKLSARNVVGWTALISGYAERGLGDDALKLFEQMKAEGVSPNAFTYASTLKACGNIRATYKGREVHDEIIVEGYEQDQFVGNSLVDMYAKIGLRKDAQEVFDELLIRDVVSWTSLITSYAITGFVEVALEHFIQMQLEGITPEAMSYNPLIMGYSKKGETRKPLRLFDQMSEQGILPDTVTYLSILKASANGSSVETVRKIHARFENVEQPVDEALSNTLINMYSKLGSMIDSQKVFDAMQKRDHVAWTSLMIGYARQKDSRHVLYLFEKMRQEGVRPDGVTFLVVLNACRVAKFVDQGQEYFEMMTKEYGISPTIQHQNSMVDLLRKAGRVDEAVAMIL